MNIHIDTSEIAKAFRGTYAEGGTIPRPIPFRIGSRVQIVSGPCTLDGRHSYHGKYIGYFGEIIRLPELQLCSCNDEGFTPTIGVLIDGRFNDRSQYGCYWFRPEELVVITEEENNMLLLKPYQLAEVHIEGYGDQHVAHYEGALGINDNVVVSKGDEYLTGIVKNVYGIGSKNLLPKFQVVCKIDDSAYLDRCARAKRAKELEDQLQSAIKDYQQMALFELMAEKSPTIAKMLEELKGITNAEPTDTTK